MKIAILSDIHSNCYALESVLNDIQQENIEQLIILGDIFGYYPWAVETYKLLLPYLKNSIVIKGNHDQLLLDTIPPHPLPSYWEAAKQNEMCLQENCLEALAWLQQLNFSHRTTLSYWTVELYHGTPEHPENGRYYPTDCNSSFDWYPIKDTIFMLGHTHYPMLVKQTNKMGCILNPGSVGQPRDGNPMPSWVLWSLEENLFEFKRTPYDNISAMEVLRSMNWNEFAINALNKTHSGRLL